MSDVLIFILTSFSIALVGYTYSVILTDADMLLDKWFMFLQKRFEEKRPKLFNVLIGCPKCVSGQWSLWLFFALPFYSYGFYAVGLHILFITVTIWFSLIINKFYQWI